MTKNSAPILWQYRWLNPSGGQQPQWMLQWKPVVPAAGQSMDSRIEEVLSYETDGKKQYEVRALYLDPLTVLQAMDPSERLEILSHFPQEKEALSRWPNSSAWMLHHMLMWKNDPPTKDQEQDDPVTQQARADLRETMDAHGWDIYGGSDEVLAMNYTWEEGFLYARTESIKKEKEREEMKSESKEEKQEEKRKQQEKKEQQENEEEWHDPEIIKPQEGQYTWVAYYPWNNPSNGLAVQAATYRHGLWILDGDPTSGEGGTSHPPVRWRENHNGPPPMVPSLPR